MKMKEIVIFVEGKQFIPIKDMGNGWTCVKNVTTGYSDLV